MLAEDVLVGIRISAEAVVVRDRADMPAEPSTAQFTSWVMQRILPTQTLLYWRIGKRIVDEVLGKEWAAYGQPIVVSVARQLVQEYGPSFGEKNLGRMMQFAEVFSEEEIVVSLIRQLSWTHFIALLPIKNPLQR